MMLGFECKLNFRKQRKEVVMSESRKCGCGRSPTGNCVGWHSLSEEEYEKKKSAYEVNQASKIK